MSLIRRVDMRSEVAHRWLSKTDPDLIAQIQQIVAGATDCDPGVTSGTAPHFDPGPSAGSFMEFSEVEVVTFERLIDECKGGECKPHTVVPESSTLTLLLIAGVFVWVGLNVSPRVHTAAVPINEHTGRTCGPVGKE